MTTVPSTFALSTLELDQLAQGLLPPTVDPVPVPHKSAGAVAPKRVLITGGAGFLAVHVLAQLVASGQLGQIVLLVRRPEAISASLARYNIDPGVLDGVQVVKGDLNEIPFDSLPDVDVVLHCAARIHGLKSLRHLWRDNVEATARLFAHYHGKAELHLVSTLSVFVSSNKTGVHLAKPLLPSEGYLLYGGYAQSKYVSERLAQAYGAHIIRLGLLTGSSTLGRFPENDFFSVFLTAMHQLGCWPTGCEDAWVDLTPVDFAAHHIVRYLVDPLRAPLTHIANFLPTSAAFLCQKMELTAVAPAVFKARLGELPGIERVLLAYAFFKRESLAVFPQYFNIDLFQTTNHAYGIDRPFPVSNDCLVSLYLKEADVLNKSA